jgi:hypothetical protein
MPLFLLVAALGWGACSEFRGWNRQVVDGFQQGLKTARESSRYQPDPLPDPVEEASGSFAARLQRDITGFSVSDVGVVMMPVGTEECGVLVIPVSWPRAAPLTTALESLGRRATESFKLGGGEFSLGTVRDQGPRAFARGSGKLSGEKLTTETWIERHRSGCLFFLAFAPRGDWDKRRHAMVSLAESFVRRSPLPLPVEERTGLSVAVPPGWDIRHGVGWMELRGGPGGSAGLRFERLPGSLDEKKPSRNLVGELSGMVRKHPALLDFRLETAKSLPDPGPGVPGAGPAAILEGTLEVTEVTIRGVVTLVGNRERGGDRLLVVRRCPEDRLPELAYLLTVVEKTAFLEKNGRRLRVARPQPWGGHPLLEEWPALAEGESPPWAARLSRDLAQAGKLEPVETLTAWILARDRRDGRPWRVNLVRRRPDGQLLDGAGAVLDRVPDGGPP